MVSILVPVYNASRYLRECVKSLTGQTYTDLQIVLINDGSTDDSWDILQELARHDQRLEIYSQSNSGVAATRNRLLDKARGEFVLFVDSDDWIELDAIEFLLNLQTKDDYDVVMFQINRKQSHDFHFNQGQVVKEFLKHQSFRGSLCDKMIKRELFNGLMIDESVGYGEDALLVWQVLQRVHNVYISGKMLYHYRVNMKSISHQYFDGNKFSAYAVWDAICSDTDKDWPQYRDIAHARFASEMVQILHSAVLSRSKYKYDYNISLLQQEIRRDGYKMRKTGISSNKMVFYAWIISRNYWLVKKMRRLVRSIDKYINVS